MPNESPNKPQNSLSERLLNHLQEVARDRDPLFAPLGHLYVHTYIQEQLSQWGEVSEEEFEYSGQTYCNLYLDLPGQSSPAVSNIPDSKSTSSKLVFSEPTPSPAVWVGAHYDAVHGSPGADDNATGIAALLEMAAAFAAEPAPLPLRLVAFDAEEYGRIGSQVAAQLAAEAGEDLRLMISLEMLGYRDAAAGSQSYPAPLDRIYPNTGDFIALVGNLRSLPDLWRWRGLLKQSGLPCQILPIWNQGRPVPRTRDSDHSAFWDLGYDAMMVTDTADLRNPNYHQGSDRIETLDLAFLSRVTEGLIQCIRSLT